MSTIRRFKCAKCGSSQHSVGKIYATGGIWSKIFDVQGRKFSTVTCEKCRYVEIYQTDASKLANVFDFFTD